MLGSDEEYHDPEHSRRVRKANREVPLWRRRLVFLCLIPTGAIIMLVAGWFPHFTNDIYSNGIYAALSPLASKVSGLLPFSIAEWLVALLAIFALYRIVRATKGVLTREVGLRATLYAGLVNTLSVVGVIYILLVLSWGINYQRPPLTTLLGYEEVAKKTPQIHELKALAESLQQDAANLQFALARNSNGEVVFADQSLRDVLNRADKGYKKLDLGANLPLSESYAPPKPVTASPLMSIVGISGIYIPHTFEANINTTLPDVLLPMIACHEMAHQRGIAKEGEANLVGYLACRAHPDADYQYSAIIWAMLYTLNAIRRVDKAVLQQITANYPEYLKKDLRALNEWRARFMPEEGASRTFVAGAQKASRAMNDTYLKANAQGEGVKSYNQFVELLIFRERAKSKATLR